MLLRNGWQVTQQSFGTGREGVNTAPIVNVVTKILKTPEFLFCNTFSKSYLQVW